MLLWMCCGSCVPGEAAITLADAAIPPAPHPGHRRRAASGARGARPACPKDRSCSSASPAAPTRSRSPRPPRSRHRRAGLRAGAVIVDHGLQPGSVDAAARAARQAADLGLAPVAHPRRRRRWQAVNAGGPEAAARSARYRVLHEAMRELDAVAVLLGHTLDDQAETVLLGLARGSGPASLSGMRVRTGPVPPPAARHPSGDDRAGLRGCRTRALARPAERRRRVHAGAGAPHRAARHGGGARSRHRRGTRAHRRAAARGLRRARSLRGGDRGGSRRALGGRHLAAGRGARREPARAPAAAHPARGLERVPRLAQPRPDARGRAARHRLARAGGRRPARR